MPKKTSQKLKREKTSNKKESKESIDNTDNTNTDNTITDNTITENTTNKEEEQFTINQDYIPLYNTLIDPEINIFSKNNDVKFSSNIDYPRFAFGFQHFIHQSKDKMERTKEFEGKKKVYQVLNHFERYIDNYDEDIGKTSKQYFDLGKNKPDILSRGFYKLWEILMIYDLIDVNNKNFTSAHLAEGP